MSQTATAPVYACRLLKGGKADAYPIERIRFGESDLDILVQQFGAEQREYDQIVQLDYHRLSALARANWDIKALKKGEHGIHRCHHKGCWADGHVYFGSNDLNRATDFCPGWVVIEGSEGGSALRNICKHSGLYCLVPGGRDV